MGKVMILTFSEDEEEVCQRMLQIISESPRFEGCNVLQVEKYLNFGGRWMDLIKIGKYIAGKRKSLGMTQKQLAEKLGMSDKSVSKWERGVSHN